MEDDGSSRRRARRRASSPQGPPTPAPGSQPTNPPTQQVDPARPARVDQHHGGSHERGLRDLVGAGRSQLGLCGALRGRDVNRPTELELADAERDVVLVRRHWKPPTD